MEILSSSFRTFAKLDWLLLGFGQTHLPFVVRLI